MKTFSSNSLIAVLLAFDLRTLAEQSTSEDYIQGATPLYIADSSFAAENQFVNCTNYNVSRGFSLMTNVAGNVDTNGYANSLGIYTFELENLDRHQALVETMPYVWFEVKPNGTMPGGALSHNKSDYSLSLIDVEYWPFMQGHIQNDLEYHVRIATFQPTDQFDLGWQSDGGQGYLTLEPEVGFSWLNSKIGTEVSIFSGLTLDDGNTTLNYQSGDVFHVDATVAHYLPLLGGSAGIGVNGYYLKQLTDDSLSFVRFGSLEMQSGGVGPVVFYVRDIGKNQLTFEAKWSPRVNVRNTTIGSFFRIEFALIF